MKNEKIEALEFCLQDLNSCIHSIEGIDEEDEKLTVLYWEFKDVIGSVEKYLKELQKND